MRDFGIDYFAFQCQRILPEILQTAKTEGDNNFNKLKALNNYQRYENVVYWYLLDFN